MGKRDGQNKQFIPEILHIFQIMPLHRSEVAAKLTERGVTKKTNRNRQYSTLMFAGGQRLLFPGRNMYIRIKPHPMKDTARYINKKESNHY